MRHDESEPSVRGPDVCLPRALLSDATALRAPRTLTMVPRVPASLGIRALLAVRRYCSDLDATSAFHQQILGFREISRSSSALEATTAERSITLASGRAVVVCTSALGPGAAERFLSLHPEGIGEVILSVDDLERTERAILENGGALLGEIGPSALGPARELCLMSPIDDVVFRLVEAEAPLFGLASSDGYSGFDHLTANFRTLAPAVLWFRQVLGLEQTWQTSFHTGATGIRSVVMADRGAGLTFALNEPLRPHFAASQIARYCDDHRGSGIQHVALGLRDLVARAAHLRGLGARFLPPAAGTGAYDEGAPFVERAPGDERALLQVFFRPGIGSGASDPGSPFFYELIERAGKEGFGEANFRALFDAVEALEATR